MKKKSFQNASICPKSNFKKKRFKVRNFCKVRSHTPHLTPGDNIMIWTNIQNNHYILEDAFTQVTFFFMLTFYPLQKIQLLGIKINCHVQILIPNDVNVCKGHLLQILLARFLNLFPGSFKFPLAFMPYSLTGPNYQSYSSWNKCSFKHLNILNTIQNNFYIAIDR